MFGGLPAGLPPGMPGVEAIAAVAAPVAAAASTGFSNGGFSGAPPMIGTQMGGAFLVFDRSWRHLRFKEAVSPRHGIIAYLDQFTCRNFGCRHAELVLAVSSIIHSGPT